MFVNEDHERRELEARAQRLEFALRQAVRALEADATLRQRAEARAVGVSVLMGPPRQPAPVVASVR